MSTTDDLFYVNGLNATTGEYGLKPMTDEDMANIIAGDEDSPPPEKPDNLSNLEEKKQQILQREKLPGLTARYKELEARIAATTDEVERKKLQAEKDAVYAEIEEIGDFGLKEGIAADRLALTGWGVIFPQSMPPAEVEAIEKQLQPLLNLRRQQVETGFVDDAITLDKYGNKQQKEVRGPFKVFKGDNGYITGQIYNRFLASNGGTVSGPVDPTKGVPYYLLIIGSPTEIPYKFQYQLDVQYAVGRIHFDELEDYRRYANSVVKAETGTVQLPRQVSFFNVENKDDKSTNASSNHLTKPLVKTFQSKSLAHHWDYALYEGPQTTKAELSKLLTANTPPTLLFTTSHGVEFAKGDPNQVADQGALVCHDWPGPRKWRSKPIDSNFYFSANDLSAEADLTGMIAFLFACYGAGTPELDEFIRLKTKGNNKKSQIADAPFVAQLPKALLRQGALAVVGHVERAWGHSFYTKGAGAQLSVFESALERLMNGYPLGSAIEYFNERYAQLATDLTSLLEEISWEAEYDPKELVSLWTSHHDARNYIIIGDPAVQVAVGARDNEQVDLSNLNANLPSSTTRTTETTNSLTDLAAVDTDTAFSVSSEETDSSDMISNPSTAISDEDWAKTPSAVQKLLYKALHLIEQMKKNLSQWDK